MSENSLCPGEGLNAGNPYEPTKKVRNRNENSERAVEKEDNMVVETVNFSTDTISQDNEKISFKDTLMNNFKGDRSSQDEDFEAFTLEEKDIEFGDSKGMPTINFSDRVHNLISQNMKLCIVVRLLGKNIGYRTLLSRILKLWKPKSYPSLVDLDNNFFLVRFYSMEDYINALSGGPWVLFGHYLTVQPWSPEFSSDKINATSVTAWVRFPGLPIQYYHNNVLKAIAKTLGKVIKIDFNTEARERGKFARLAINLDLTKPLCSRILLDGRLQKVEYEGLPIICFNCGRYGHRENLCTHKNLVEGVSDSPMTEQVPAASDPVSEPPLVVESPPFGPWMQVVNRRRKPDIPANNQGNNGNKHSGSRFDAIASLEENFQGQFDTTNNKNNFVPYVQKETIGSQLKKIPVPILRTTNQQGKFSETNINATNKKMSMQVHADTKAQFEQKNKTQVQSSIGSNDKSKSISHMQNHADPKDIQDPSGSMFFPVEVSLNQKNHSAVALLSPVTDQNHCQQLKLLSLRDKFTPKGPDKQRNHWNVKINQISKNNSKAKKRMTPKAISTNNIGDILMEITKPVQTSEGTSSSPEIVVSTDQQQNLGSSKDQMMDV
ncbi:uncharacterized protein LOC126668568 [Mercurialis annua]|uniref:uncharacterized protein LOC126668568 n=1 Tax=Mercurialis annua TaxID=3986 RepID=UPI00215E3105|nr:uncharacterized protein LOC126668568 [Mercurialis annua]